MTPVAQGSHLSVAYAKQWNSAALRLPSTNPLGAGQMTLDASRRVEWAPRLGFRASTSRAPDLELRRAVTGQSIHLIRAADEKNLPGLLKAL